MSDKLGFTFYPKDWWTSDSYFELEPIERYIYLESLFIMYSNEGYMKTQKAQMERRISIQISDEQWDKITSKFIIDNDMFTHKSVNKRLRRAIANRENGSKGGRPRKEEVMDFQKPKKPNLETQINPSLEREREREREREKKEEYVIVLSDILDCLNKEIGSEYRTSSKKTQTVVLARLKEGFTPEQFKQVIKYKSQKWLNDEKYRMYLRPETLFGSKMESYLQEMKIDKSYSQYPQSKKEYSSWS